MPQSKHPTEFRAKVSQEYLDGMGSFSFLTSMYGIDCTTLKGWVNEYRIHGISAFCHQKNRTYTKELKIKCVEAVINSESSVDDIIAQHGISSRSILRQWIKVYNTNRELKDYDPKQEVYMAEARRKATFEERKEIVDYCIKHNRDYKNTATKYGVSYNQVYSWIKKYDANGEKGLTTRRGHRKTDNEVDELECLRRENLRLKRQLEEKDIVIELLKKSERIRKDVRLGKVRHKSNYLTIKYFHKKLEYRMDVQTP